MRNINSLISILMSISALVYLSVMGYYCSSMTWFIIVPSLLLLAGSMYFIINPDLKVEW